MVYNSEDKEVCFYGLEKIKVAKEWNEYMIGEFQKTKKKEKMKNLSIYLSIFGGILLFIIICLIIRQIINVY